VSFLAPQVRVENLIQTFYFNVLPVSVVIVNDQT